MASKKRGKSLDCRSEEGINPVEMGFFFIRDLCIDPA